MIGGKPLTNSMKQLIDGIKKFLNPMGGITSVGSTSPMSESLKSRKASSNILGQVSITA